MTNCCCELYTHQQHPTEYQPGSSSTEQVDRHHKLRQVNSWDDNHVTLKCCVWTLYGAKSKINILTWRDFPLRTYLLKYQALSIMSSSTVEFATCLPQSSICLRSSDEMIIEQFQLKATKAVTRHGWVVVVLYEQ